MKYIILLLLSTTILLAQNIIDPPAVIVDTMSNYNVIEKVQDEFILGWNWGTPGKKVDNALCFNLS